MTVRAPISAFLRWPTERSRIWLQQYLAEAATAPDILAVVAIGSGVRPGVASVDLDLLVVTAGVPRPVNAPIEIDVRQYQANELEAKLVGGHDLVGWAVLFGVVLLEKAAFWTAFVEKHRDHVPLPSAEVARDRAARAQRHLERLLAVADEDAAAEQLVSFVTHIGRAALIDAGVYPISRPELPGQLRSVGENSIAEALEQAIARERPTRDIYVDFHSLRP